MEVRRSHHPTYLTAWSRWRQQLGWLLVACAGLWCLLLFGVWLFVKYYRDFPDVRYADLVWPGNWPSYRVRQGDHYIAQSHLLLQLGDLPLALHKLRTGVAKSPDNPQGRILLSRIYLASRRPELAAQVLVEGLPRLGKNSEYLQATLALLLEQHEDAQLIEITGRMLADSRLTAVHPLLAIFGATAAYHRGNHHATEDLLFRHHLRDSLDGAILQARILWDRGWSELALIRLQEHLALHPRHDTARALLADYYLQLGRITDWESTLVERVAADPLAPAPRVAYLQLHHRRGDSARLQQETTAFLAQFGRDPAALLLLANFAATTGHPNLAREVQQALAASPEHAATAALMVAEAHLAAREYQPTLDLLARHSREFPEWAAQFAAVFDGLQAIALSGLGRTGEARLALDRLLTRPSLRAENLTAVASRLSALGASDLAGHTLRRAVETDPLNQAALASLIRLRLEHGDAAGLPAHLEKFLRTRQPSPDLLAQARALLGSDRHLLLPEQKKLLASLQSALGPHRP